MKSQTYRLVDPEAPGRNLTITITKNGKVLAIKEKPPKGGLDGKDSKG